MRKQLFLLALLAGILVTACGKKKGSTTTITVQSDSIVVDKKPKERFDSTSPYIQYEVKMINGTN